MLLHEEIEEVRFSRTFNGYSPREVDAFLEHLRAEAALLFTENEELKKRLAEVSASADAGVIPEADAEAADTVTADVSEIDDAAAAVSEPDDEYGEDEEPTQITIDNDIFIDDDSDDGMFAGALGAVAAAGAAAAGAVGAAAVAAAGAAAGAAAAGGLSVELVSGDGAKSDDGNESDGLSDIDVFELFGLSDDEEEYEGEGNGDAGDEQTPETEDGAVDADAADTDAAANGTDADGGFFRLPEAGDEGEGIGADGADDTAEIAAFDLASREVGDETSPAPAEEMTEEAEADEPAAAEADADTQDAAEPEEPEKVEEPEQTTGTYQKRTYRMRKKAASAARPEDNEDADAPFADETSAAEGDGGGDDAFDTDAEDDDILAALKAEYGDDDNKVGAGDNDEDEELETKEYDEYHYFFGFGKKKNKKDKGKK